MRQSNVWRMLDKWLLATLLLFGPGCDQAEQPEQVLTLATTTSTRDSGLLDVLVPAFEAETGLRVKVVAVGSGQALELGRRGDADVLLTHAPDAERQFVADRHARRRRSVMYNDFIIVGPPADPAHVESHSSVVALQRIGREQAPFISRGDDSGTHMREQRLWREAGVEPAGPWYVRSGSGMAEALRMASEKRAYTLSDRSTFLAQRRRLELEILSEGDPILHNPYSVMVVSRETHPGVNEAGAVQFADFLVSPEGQKLIGQYGIERFGQPLFFTDS